jgi:hypothetical protein
MKTQLRADVTIKSLYDRYKYFDDEQVQTIKKPSSAMMMKSEPCEDDGEIDDFNDLKKTLENASYNPLKLMERSKMLESYLLSTLVTDLTHIEVRDQCSEMQFSKEVFKKTLFLKIIKNANGNRKLRCFINNRNIG